MALTDEQKKAHKRYNEKVKAEGLRKNVTISLSTGEAEMHRLIMQEHGVTPIQVWRTGINAISEQPKKDG